MTQGISSLLPLLYKTENEVFCEREGDWGDTKVNFTAVLKCMNSAGKRFRGCKQGGEWDEEESMCVNMDLNKIREWTEVSQTVTLTHFPSYILAL